MRSAGPELLRHVSKVNDTVDVRSPLTPTLSLSIATVDRPDAQSTMGLYFAKGGTSNKVLGLTCHHVLFRTDATTNDSYILANDASAPRKYVRFLLLALLLTGALLLRLWARAPVVLAPYNLSWSAGLSDLATCKRWFCVGICKDRRVVYRSSCYRTWTLIK
ncbi:hypothetical protein PUNSTDRAFT_110061 [Punctularia strigosozonata HHB-11173 SS5]|uniref:uncharacterized protein n=1 Tax=Punctularia strigosozonata (strain HHB-11173) TaxID=741275 RepID=UPI0004417905|nr:uncharacterized protein PUNSTDRAFT_110061 [Punctularia strigosozonata HHB-11173 SS5]EIN13898.1 hypothetical protein PUNSTDRAFT_110061 [Punctularia strigosozonata HHB-11173 SS5]